MCHLVLPEWGVKEKGKVVRQNTGERHPMEAMALSIIQGQLANGVVYMQAATHSHSLSLLSFFVSLPSHTHRSRRYMHIICMILRLDFDAEYHRNLTQAFCLNMYTDSMLYCCVR